MKSVNDSTLKGVRKGCFFIWLFFISWGILYFGLAYIQKKWDPANKVSFSSGSICAGYDPNTGSMVSKGDVFAWDAKSIGVCGSLETTVPVHLSIYWFENGKKKPIYTNPTTEEFQQGNIVSQLEGKLDSGNYRVEVWYGRSLLSTILFEISP